MATEDRYPFAIEFAVEGCYLMRDRFLAPEIFETLGLPASDCVEYVQAREDESIAERFDRQHARSH